MQNTRQGREYAKFTQCSDGVAVNIVLVPGTMAAGHGMPLSKTDKEFQKFQQAADGGSAVVLLLKA